MVKYCAILFLLKRPLTRALLCILFCCGVSLLPSHLPRALLPKRGEYTSLLWIFVAKKCGCYDVLLLASDSVPSFLLVTVGNPVLPALGSAHQPLHPTLTKVSILWQVTWWWIVCSDIPCRVFLFFFQLHGTSSSFGIFWQASNAACFRAETFYWLMGFFFFVVIFFWRKFLLSPAVYWGPSTIEGNLEEIPSEEAAWALPTSVEMKKKDLQQLTKNLYGLLCQKLIFESCENKTVAAAILFQALCLWCRKHDHSCCHFISGTLCP